MSVDWLALFQHFASLSLLAVGGVISTLPEMHRYLVDESAWLTDAQFVSSIALAQAAPGPNVLFVALIGWNVGLNVESQAPTPGGIPWMALLGMTASMAGTMLPSSILAYRAGQWIHRNRDRRAVRGFRAGMAPIVISLMLSTAWLLTSAHDEPSQDWSLWLTTALSALLMWRTRLHILWLLGAGAVLGAFGLV
jgi:chromate transporter